MLFFDDIDSVMTKKQVDEQIELNFPEDIEKIISECADASTLVIFSTNSLKDLDPIFRNRLREE